MQPRLQTPAAATASNGEQRRVSIWSPPTQGAGRRRLPWTPPATVLLVVLLLSTTSSPVVREAADGGLQCATARRATTGISGASAQAPPPPPPPPGAPLLPPSQRVAVLQYTSTPTASETALSPSTVSPNLFGKLGSWNVSGIVQAQPLLVPGVQVVSPGQGNGAGGAGASVDLLIVATQQNWVYGVDAGDPGRWAVGWAVVEAGGRGGPASARRWGPRQGGVVWCLGPLHAASGARHEVNGIAGLWVCVCFVCVGGRGTACTMDGTTGHLMWGPTVPGMTGMLQYMARSC